MPVFAILLDLLTAVAYFVQLRSMSPAFFMLGAGLQIIVSVILLILIFNYQGRHRKRYWTDGYRPFTFGYGIIVISFVVNALIAVLYVFNLLNINHVIFGL